MARRNTAELAQHAETPAQPQDPQADAPAAEGAGFSQSMDAPKSKWVSRFDFWDDYQAGVHLAEDRENHRMTIKFDEKPSEPVRNVMKKEHAYQFDGEDQLWWKRVNFAKPRQTRQEAEDLAFQVANMIRQEKGLEQKQSFSLSA